MTFDEPKKADELLWSVANLESLTRHPVGTVLSWAVARMNRVAPEALTQLGLVMHMREDWG